MNQSNALVSDNANNNVVVVGSDNQTYTDDTATLSEGTNFDSGDYNIGPGASTTGWVAFQLRTGVNVSKIQFTFQTGTGSSVGEWLP